MRTKKAFFCFVLLLFLCLGYGARLDAVIYEIAAVGPKSSGMMGSVAATADDLIDAIYFNPAALSLVAGSNVTAGSGIVSWPLEYEHPNGYKP